MTSYEQHMKHWKKKKGAYQQCSGYWGIGATAPSVISKEKESLNSRESMARILSLEHEYPIFLHQMNDGFWETVPSNHLFGEKIDSKEDLLAFSEKYA